MNNNCDENLLFGREFDEGWNNLYDDLLNELGPYNVMIIQAKEKYVRLWIYCEPCPDEIFDILRKYEDMSETVCEVCGKEGSIHKIFGDWLKTLCDNCYTTHL